MRPISWNNLIEIYLGRNMIGDRGLKYISMIEMNRIEKIDICIIIMNELLIILRRLGWSIYRRPLGNVLHG